MTSIFVAKLDFGVDDQQLRELFSEYGRVLKATVALDRETRKSRGFGFVEMADADEAAAAISALDGHRINGRPIAVKEAEDRGGNKRPPRGGGDRKPFNNDRQGGGDRRPSGDRPPRDARPSGADSPRPFTPGPDAGADADGKKPALDRKKDREPKKKQDKPKTHKMEAYKKSGKNNIFIDDEDEEPLSLFDYDDDEDFDTSYLVNNDEDYDDDEEYDEDED